MPHDVFISYSSNDKLTAEAACAAFEQHGIRCWIAPRDIAPGAEWGEAIIDAIDECPVMVLIFSAHANESRQVRRELERAVSSGTTIMPVRLENIEPSRSVAYFVAGVHWLDALTPPLEAHFQRLAQTIKSVLAARVTTTAPAATTTPAAPTTTAAPPAATTAPPTTTMAPAPTPPPRPEDAKALNDRAQSLVTLERYRDALPLFSQIAERFGGLTDAPTRELVAEAGYRIGVMQDMLPEKETAIATFRALRARRDSVEAPLRYWTFKAGVYEAAVLTELGRQEEAYRVNEEMLAWIGFPVDDRTLGTLALSMANRVKMLRTLQRYPEVFTAAAELVDRLGSSKDPTTRMEIGRAIYVEGQTHVTMDRKDEAIAAFTRSIDKLKELRNGNVPEYQSNALLDRASIYFERQRYADALADYDAILLLTGETPTALALRTRHVQALYARGLSLKWLDRKAEALAAFDEAVRRYQNADEPTIIDFAAKSMTQARTLRGS